MVRHVINRYHILALPGYDAGHVFLKLIVMLWPDQALPPLHRENNLDVDLGVRIRHSMSLLRSLPPYFRAIAIKISLLRCWGGFFSSEATRNPCRCASRSDPLNRNFLKRSKACCTSGSEMYFCACSANFVPTAFSSGAKETSFSWARSHAGMEALPWF